MIPHKLLSPPSVTRPTIWVVDDSASETEMVRQALAPSYDVVTFRDWAEMLEALARQPAPQVLVLDWLMPGLSGIEVCQFLRANEATEGLPILMLTSHSRPEDLVAGLAAGANDYVSKPFRAGELVARVAALVRMYLLRERAERAEAAALALLRELPEALLTLDSGGRLTYVNAEAERMLGARAQQLLGRPVRELLPGLAVDSIPDVSTELFPLPDLRLGERYLAPVVRPLAVDSEASTTISLRDVTAERHLQARRLDFYSVIAHDLRTPLQAVLLRTQLMLAGKGGTLSEQHREDLLRIQQRIGELGSMVGDFLELARLEAAGLKLEPHELDLAELLCAAFDDYQVLAERGGVQLACAPRGEHVKVVGDRRRLGQVVNNLVSNAIKFTGRGGRVEARVQREDGWVEAQIHDTGRGIAPEALPSLFDRYTRAPEEHTTPGSGLGLMIVREIVEAHGGSVGVHSEAGAGSTFWFRLPEAGPAHH
ncbi:MAG TPA: ATP-binding protein [Aggregicoccus sp.]|nr:ATP-binding protein [Aggregicoccus sp.]